VLIAEDLLLLLTDDDTGRLAASATLVDIALGGALLVELALGGHVDTAGPDERVHRGRLIVRDAAPTGDDVLDDALATLAGKEGKKPQTVVTALGKGTRVRLYERLAQNGVLREEDGRILGLFPTHHWPTQDAGHEAGVRAALEANLRHGSTTDSRVGAIIALLAALNAVHDVVDPERVGLSERELRTRASRIAEGDWAAAAVRSAIAAMMAAIIAASSSAVVVPGSTGS
jgi:hypothetical protein